MSPFYCESMVAWPCTHRVCYGLGESLGTVEEWHFQLIWVLIQPLGFHDT